jgi:penicillin-binding protein-related factor A (putative recombinase)
MSGRGKRLESIVRKAARSLADRDIARIYRWPEAKATKMIPSRCACGRVEVTMSVVHTEAPGADFWGFTTSGRVVMIECKESGKPSLPMGEAGLKSHQRLALMEVHAAGGIALLAWYRLKQIAVIDMDIVARLTKGRKSLPWKEIPEEFIHQESDVDGLLSPYLEPSRPCC